MNSSIREIQNLDELLSRYLRRSVKVLKQDSKLLTAPGENYGSVMMALSVTTVDERNSEEHLNLVAKTIPTNEMLRKLFQVQISFVKELNVYVKIVPALRDLEDEHSVNTNRASDLFCRCYGGRNNLQGNDGIVDENAVILLENLKLSGYSNGDRLHGFNFDAAVLVLQNLARFHATPIALKILKPQVFESTIGATFAVVPEPNKLDAHKIDRFVTGLQGVIVHENEDNEKELLPYAREVVKNVRATLADSMFQKDDPKKPFVTFGHSDFWVNNMMIRNDEDNKPASLKIIDFQTPGHQSLACDLLFFMYSSISADVLYSNEDEFLRIYYDSFINCLEAFELKDLEDFTWDKFISEIQAQSSFVLSQIMFMYKVILMERGEIDDMNNFNEDHMFNFDNVSDNCKFRMKKTFESFVKRGWLD